MQAESYDRPLILIAERDPFMRRSLTHILEEAFEVFCVEDGGDVLEQVKARLPALIILPAMLPTRDGFQVCRQLKADPAVRSIPVLFFSVLLAEERALQAGADAFLLKPIRKAELLQTIYRLLAVSATSQGDSP